ncbi:MAG: hypothetical protein QM757_26650 [Paludibaculum sp.]
MSTRTRAAKTLQEKLGFLDTDLSTPAHDLIMLWLESAVDDLPELCGFMRKKLAPHYTPAAIDQLMAEGVIYRKTMEAPIVNRSIITGFADLECRLATIWQQADGRVIRCESEWVACFEVKSEIPSIGELIRQIRAYGVYQKDCLWFVVSPDDRFAGVLKRQGIGFLKVPSEVLSPRQAS